MNVTLEHRLDSLTQMVEAIAGAVNKKETSVKVETRLPDDSQRVNLSTDLCDYDFAAFESRRGEKVVSIVTVPASIVRPAHGAPLALLTVRMASGKTPLCKAPFVKGQARVSPKPSAVNAVPARNPSDATNIGDIAIASAAAMNLERLATRSPALQSFYAFTHAKGAEYCHGVLKPFLAHESFPAGASTGQRITHLRGLLAKHVAPQVEKSAPAQFAAVVAEQPRKPALTLTAINARHRLEKELVPVKVGGKWTVPSIGADEQEWIESPSLQREFPGGPRSYAAYVRRCGKPELSAR